MYNPRDNLVLFSGYAKLPTGITASEMYKLIGIVVLVDISTGVVVEADCTLATELARRHVSKSIAGYDLNRGNEPLQQMLDKVYQGSAKKAVTTVIRIIYDKYRSYKQEMAQDAKDET
ncbi:MAG: DUF3870 domain-containing protein [Acidaminococcales bacterium]|jgi:hypothetical protein|nr:DUF3870 domain-containing protein [Acidaminococcales bacterium]